MPWEVRSAGNDAGAAEGRNRLLGRESTDLGSDKSVFPLVWPTKAHQNTRKRWDEVSGPSADDHKVGVVLGKDRQPECMGVLPSLKRWQISENPSYIFGVGPILQSKLNCEETVEIYSLARNISSPIK